MITLAWLVEVGMFITLCDLTQKELFQTFGFGLLLFRAYSTWKDSLSTPILSALIR